MSASDDMKLDLADVFGDALASESGQEKKETVDAKQREELLKEREAEIARKEKELSKLLKAQLAEKEVALQKVKKDAEKEAAEHAQKEEEAKKAIDTDGADDETKKWAEDVLAKSEEQKERLSAEQNDFELLMIYEQLRDVLYFKLAPIVGDKATKTMLVRSVEKVNAKFPDIFKNANFNDKGGLVDGGELNAKKIIDNKSKLDVAKGYDRMLLSFKTLLEFRLLAVQKGLGQGVVKAILVSMNERLAELGERHGKENIAILKKMLPKV